jgi:hypothetical protein
MPGAVRKLSQDSDTRTGVILMKTGLYVPKIHRVEVTLTFLVSGLRQDPGEDELYNILEDIGKGHEGVHQYGSRVVNLMMESAAAATKRRTQ